MLKFTEWVSYKEDLEGYGRNYNEPQKYEPSDDDLRDRSSEPSDDVLYGMQSGDRVQVSLNGSPVELTRINASKYILNGTPVSNHQIDSLAANNELHVINPKQYQHIIDRLHQYK